MFDLLAEFKAAQDSTLSSTLAKHTNDISANVSAAVANYDKKVEHRVRVIDQSIRNVDARATALETENQKLWEAVNNLQRTIILEEAKSGEGDPSEFFRSNDLASIRIRTAENLTKMAVEPLVQKLANAAGLDKDGYTL